LYNASSVHLVSSQHSEAMHLTKQFDHVRLLQMSIAEASALCRRPWMRTALHDWLRKQGWDALAAQLDSLHAEESNIMEAASIAESTSC
jgi:hypothetical protein